MICPRSLLRLLLLSLRHLPLVLFYLGGVRLGALVPGVGRAGAGAHLPPWVRADAVVAFPDPGSVPSSRFASTSSFVVGVDTVARLVVLETSEEHLYLLHVVPVVLPGVFQSSQVGVDGLALSLPVAVMMTSDNLIVGGLSVLELLDSRLGLDEVLVCIVGLRIKLQIDRNDLGVGVRQVCLAEKEDCETGFRELFSHFLHLGIIFLKSSREIHQVFSFLPAGIEECVEDLHHIHMLAERELGLEPLHDLVDAVLRFSE